MQPAGAAPRLLADIGGTHTRLTLARVPKGFAHTETFDNARFPDLASLVESFLKQLPDAERPQTGAFAVASPVDGDKIRMTNCGWEFSLSSLCKQLGLDALYCINDFTAIALAIPRMGPEDTIQIGAGAGRARAPIGVIGPGTGLGVSGLIPCGDGWVPLLAEGGHVTLAAATEEESRVLDRLRERFGHASAERVLSGPGLAELYKTLAQITGQEAQSGSSEEISQRAIHEKDSVAVNALSMYFAMLGTVAGNLALTLGARGGIYLAGGILPTMPDALQHSRFRERFIEKGRYRSYLNAIPTFLVVEPYPAFIGLLAYLETPAST